MALVKRSHGVLTKVFRSTATVFINTCSSLMTDGAPAGQLVADSDHPVEVKPELLALSDDEAAAPALEQPLAKPKPSPSKGADMDVGLCRRKLSKVVWTVCPCARPLRKKTVNCFTQFRTETDVGVLAALYIRLRRLAKADMDAEVSKHSFINLCLFLAPVRSHVPVNCLLLAGYMSSLPGWFWCRITKLKTRG